ncbi:cytoglobin-2 [Hyalella azteca]|uniref:Cytoglobin-2 n=1 Tax=Hyalella azteca TaxID=294128 RepID=A0A8B7N2V7_HYAAZ|nr:cytoglobin-2 [Hyalella azteca]
MGALISSLFSWLFGGSKYPALGPNPDKPNDITGLTPREARAVVVTWDIVKPNMAHHGVQFFLRLFERHPNIQKKFSGFDGKPLAVLQEDKRLRAHATTVMNAINSVVESLGDPETLVEILKTTGKNHKRRGIEKTHFESLRVVLLDYLRDNLGTAYSPMAQQGWSKALAAVNAVIFQAYDLPEK